ncbi:hypothetical protein [Marinobacter nanhaiticus]|uniref:hypothetical protein n=1 Tax=Marinobacter nanhaiticus TaxID=1305740 RepID=UPI0002CBED4F|nr:hypothetical protein [Marinobacter nanhaiticus]
MERKPDVIRALVFLFAMGLAVTGFTSLQASEPRSKATAEVIDSPLMPMLEE